MPISNEHTANTEYNEQELYTVYTGEKINVYGIPFEHGPITAERVEEFKQNLESIGADGLIAEYFGPADINGKLITTLINNNSAPVKITEEVEQLVNYSNTKTKVFCLDPAHDESWTMIDGLLMESTAVPGLFTAYAAGIAQLNTDKNDITRRAFLKGLMGISAGVGLLSLTSIVSKGTEMISRKPLNTPINPQALRRLVVAQNILEMDKVFAAVPGNDKNQKLNLALYYPTVHLQGIYDYLHTWTPDNEKIANYIRSFSDYKDARVYSKDEMGRWKKQILRLQNT